MPKTLVIYGSTISNIENAVHAFAKTIAEEKIVAHIKEVGSAELIDFTSRYDLIVLGCSTWGN